ncbi:MAG: hypothetical protein U9O94_01660 [Nanoarchaeota archaeon]|nr:hypothetical protein [Nanoarchaeota archaeon]
MSKLLRKIRKIIRIAKKCRGESNRLPKGIRQTKKNIVDIEDNLRRIVELDNEEYEELKAQIFDIKLLDGCKAIHKISVKIIDILEKEVISNRDINKIKSLLTIIIDLEKKILFEERRYSDGPKNKLLFHLKRGSKISEFSLKELRSYSSEYMICLGDGTYRSVDKRDHIPPQIILRDVYTLKRILPKNIFRETYITLIGRIKKLSSNENKYLKMYVIERWKKLSGFYDTSGIPIPKVIFVGWLMTREGGRFDGKKITLHDIYDEESLIHEMIHHCQYARHPYKLKSVIFQNRKEKQARLVREMEAYSLTKRIMGRPISVKEARRRAIASIFGG